MSSLNRKTLKAVKGRFSASDKSPLTQSEGIKLFFDSQKSSRIIEYRFFITENPRHDADYTQATSITMSSQNNGLVRVGERYLDPLRQGASMRNVLSLLREDLPLRPFGKTARDVIDGSAVNLPCLVQQGMKRVGAILDVDTFRDLVAFRAELLERHRKRDHNYGLCFLITVPPYQTPYSQVHYAEVLLSAKSEKIHIYDVIGFEASDAEFNDGLFNGVFIPKAVLTYLQQNILDHTPELLDEDVAQNCPTAPPGEWFNYLEDIMKERNPAYQEFVKNNPDPIFVAPPATDEKAGTKASTGGPATKQVQPPKPARLPTGTLLGLDALAVLQKVLTSPDGFFTCEIDATAEILPEYKPPVTVKERRTPSRNIRNQPEEPRLVDLKEALVRSKIAVMEASRFKHIVDNWRYAGTHLLERMLGRELHFDRVNMVDITPAQIGLVPTIVAGLHRPRRDRLGTARLSLMYRAEGDDEEKLHTLVFYPSGWMSPVAEVWMTGLFGTPVDPTLLDFCKTLSPEWWTDLAKVIPPKGVTPPMLDIRTLQP